MAMTYSPAFQKTISGMQGTPSINYGSYTSAIGDLRNAQQNAQGYINPNLSVAGSEAAGYAQQAGAIEQQRGIDPWSFYRGSAADKLATQIGQGSPADFYANRLKSMLTGNFDATDPSYQWRFDQGQQALERSLAARGLLNSGNAGIELQQYGQGAASQEYQAQFERLLRTMGSTEDVYNNSFNRLSQLAGINNVGANLSQQQINIGAAQTANEDMGIGAALNQQSSPISGNFGGGGGSDWSGVNAGANQMENNYQNYQNSLNAARMSSSYYR